MPQYEISVPGQGTFQVNSPTDLTDSQVWQAVQGQLKTKQEPESGALVSGFKSYLPQLQETYGGLKTLLGVGAERVLGEGDISRSLIASGAASLKEAEQRMKPLATPERSSFSSALDKGVGSVLTEWLPYQAGSGAANILEALGTMVAGSAIGSALPGAGTVAGAGTGLVARELVKKGVKEAAQKILKEHGEDVAQEYFEKEAIQAARKIGQTAALGAQAGFYGAGQATSRAVDEAEKLGGTASDIELARVLPASAVSAVAEFLGDRISLGALEGLKAAKPGKSATLDLAKNVLLNIGVTGTKEAPVEVIQSAAERFGAKLSLADAEALKEYIDSAAASYGMAVGPGAAGGVRQTLAERSQQEEPAPITSQEERRAELLARYEELKRKSAGVPEQEIEQPDGTKVVVPAQPGQYFTEQEQKEFGQLKAIFEPEVELELPSQPSVQEQIEEVTGVSRAAPQSAEESLLGSLYKLDDAEAEAAREELTRQRLLRQQQEIDAEAERIAELNRKQGMPSPDRPKLEIEERPSIAEAPSTLTPREDLLAKQAEVDRRRLEAGLPTGESSVTPGIQAPTPIVEEPKPEPKIVDERPMQERAAQLRLMVMRNMLKNQGGDPESLAVAPHPTIEGRFVIQSLDVPTKFTRDLPATAATKPESPPIIDPVNAYVEIQRRTNTPAARRFVQDFESGRITRKDVEQAIEQEQKAAQPQPLTYTSTGAPGIIAPEISKPRGEREVPKLGQAPADVETPTEPPVEEPPSPSVGMPKSLQEFEARMPTVFDKVEVRKANNEGNFGNMVRALQLSTNPAIRRIGELGEAIASKITLRKPGGARQLGAGVAGVYRYADDSIQMLREHAGNEHTNAHETVHALISKAQRNPTDRQKPTVEKIKKLYEHVNKELRRKGITAYGLTNEREFTAEAMTNPAFQYELMQIPYPGSKSAWSKFVQLVADLLGIENTNALTEVMVLTERLAKMQAPRKRVTDRGLVDITEDRLEVEQPSDVEKRKSLGGKKLGFYSELENKVEQIGPKQAPAAMWKTMINALTQKGVKPDEIEWSGVNDWLDLQQGKVTKDQVLEYLKQGGVQVEETVLGRADLTELRAFKAEMEAKYGRDWREEINMQEDYKLTALTERLKETSNTKYGQYTLPGGENYREVLLTLPEKTPQPLVFTRSDDALQYLKDSVDTLAVIDASGRKVGEVTGSFSLEKVAPDVDSGKYTLRAVDPAQNSKLREDKNYRSSHWDQPNVLAHIRLNDRTDADGKRVLFVEEIQSDWGQEGKKRGFGEKLADGWSIKEQEPGFFLLFMDGRSIPMGSGTKEQVMAKAKEYSAVSALTPPAPFVTKTEGWLNLALKRVMIMAAEGGYDKVAFVNGEQSADRYDLSKQIDRIDAKRKPNGMYELDFATKDGRDFNRDLNESELEANVGKEMAKKIVDATQESNRRVRFSGLDLKVGGEGMKTFYDTIVPTALKKLLPKVGGGQMGVVRVNGKESVPTQTVGSTMLPPFSRDSVLSQPGFDITPAMRQLVEQKGLPLFSKKGTGAQRQNFEQALRTLLNKFGLKDVGLSIVEGMDDAGSYAQQLIRIAAEAASPIRTLRHEAIHALRELGFFTDAQWNSLSKMAKDKWIDQYLKQRNVDGKPLKAGEESRYDAYMREYKGDMEKITEEAVADAFADFDATKPPAGLLQTLLKRLRDLFQSIKSALTKVESVDQIFGKVEKGELKAGAREVRGEAKSLRDRATENFKRWFGDSKVVDKNGEPLVVYHGTNRDFNTFEERQDQRLDGGWYGRGFYFAPSAEDASFYAGVRSPEGANVIPAYLSIKKPYRVDSTGTVGFEAFREKFKKDFGQEAFDEVAGTEGNTNITFQQNAREWLEARDYDGVMATRNGRTVEIVAFRPNQIKSAISNNGEYSLTNADIRKSIGGAKAVFKEDLGPNDAWLQGKIKAAVDGGRNQFGVPNKMGPITGSFSRPLNLPTYLLGVLKGESGEQRNVRKESLEYIRKNWSSVKNQPIYVEVDPFGQAWVSEGNHRIMVARELGEKTLPVEIRYFSGGQNNAGPFTPQELLKLDARPQKDERKSIGGVKGTPGQQALETIRAMGMDVPKPDPTKLEKAKAIWTKAKEDPKLTAQSAARTVRDFLDRVETWTFSSDAKLNNDYRRAVIKDFKQNEGVLGQLLEMSQSQAVHADALASQFLIDGGLKYNDKLKKWESFGSKANFPALSKLLDEIGKKYGLSKEQIERVAHAYLVAKRLPGILERNSQIDAEIAAENATAKPDKRKIKDLEDKKVFVSDKQLEQIEPGLSLAKTIPELKQVSDMWNEIRKNTIDVMVNSGLWSPEYAQAMWDNMDYVPYYRDDQIENEMGPQEFIKGLQVKSKEFQLKGSEDAVHDVFDNMIRWTQYAINRSVRAHKALQMIDNAKDIDVGDRKMAVKVDKEKRGMNIARVFRDGKQELYDMADPLYMQAFAGIQNVSIPTLTWMSKVSDVLRNSVVLYPMFSILQVPQDAYAAMFSSGLKPQHALKIPVLAVKEFLKTLAKTSQTHNELKRFGATGVRDFSATVIRDDAEIYAGLKPPRGGWGKVKEALSHVSMAADNAVRQAVYEASIAQGVSRAEALEKAFEVINFRRKGTSRMLNIMGQTIPFFYAYLSALRVSYKTLTGVGISPSERKEALTTFAMTSAAVATLSMLYAMANGDDEDYAETPAAIRDRTLTIPGSGGVRIPLRSDFFLFPKMIAEHTYLLLADKGFEDSAKFKKSMADGLWNAVASPTPFPTAVKAPLEVAINYDLFQGKPLIGQFEKQKDVERQFRDSTSELAKLIGQTGLISPIAVDHLIRGMFGSFGGLVLFGTNQFLHSDPNVPRPELSTTEMLAALPGTSGVLKRPQESALKNDFYTLRDEVEKAVNTFNDIKTRSPEGAEAFLEDEKNMARLMLGKPVDKINQELSKIRRVMTQITNMPEDQMSAAEKAEMIREYRQVERDMLMSVDVKALREMAKI